MSETQATPQEINQAAYIDVEQERKPDFGARHKRGVGSIIGTVFIALILLSGFAFYALTLDTTQNYNNTISSMSGLDWNRSQENIVFKQISITGTNRLNVTAENDGSIQSHLTWLGIFNKTANPENQTYQALNEYIRPGETDNIISNSTVTTGNNYVIQLVSELGNTVESKFYPVNFVSCALTLVTTPPTVYQGNNITLLFTVTPNDTVVDFVQSLTATINATPSNLVQLVGNSSLTTSGLTRGTSAFFWWIYNATNTGTATFNATYLQAPAGIYALSNLNVLASPGQGAGGSVSISGLNGTAKYNPSNWTLLGATQYVGGSASDLATNDSNYVIFSSYNSTFIYSPNNNSSDVDLNGNLGSQSNLTALGYGPDGIMDTFTEDAVPAGSEQWTLPTGYLDPSSAWTSETNAYDNSTSTAAQSTIYGYSWSGYLTLTHNAITCGKIQYYIGRSSFQINDVQIDIYNSTWTNVYDGGGQWNTWANVSFAETSVTQMRIRFYNSDYYFHTAYIYETQFLQDAPPPNYRLDLEVQWTGVNYTMANEWLCIYGGTMSAENLTVDVWSGSAWNNVIANLTSNWNNVSVSSYMVSPNFTIRFRDATPNDLTQHSWQVDVCLLEAWNGTFNQNTAEVEFVGSSDLQNWASLVWQVDTAWNTGSVNVEIQLFNYTLGGYMPSGSGYINYTSSSTPNVDESKSQNIVLNPTSFRNSTGYWKVKIKGVKTAGTQFQMKINWIELQDSYTSSGDTIPYNAWQWYTIQATGASGNPIPFTYASLYSNGTTVTFQNARDGTTIPNPAWLRLDANGTFQLLVKSANSSGETFVLYVSVGTVVQQKTITQAAQQ
jgi:hypothetical protein